MKKRKSEKSLAASVEATGYDAVLGGLVALLERARRSSARAVNRFMTATYWEVGRRIVDGEEGGEMRAEYGKAHGTAHLGCGNFPFVSHRSDHRNDD